MPLITVKEAVPVVAPGTYRATLIAVRPKKLATRYSKPGTEDDFLEWSWDINGEEVRSLTTVASGPKSKINEYLVALMGADKVQIGAGFDEGDLVGKQAMLQIVLNEDGFSKVDRLMAVPKDGGTPIPQATIAPAEQGTGSEPPDDLPF